MPSPLAKVPYDPELESVLAQLPLPPFITEDMIVPARQQAEQGASLTPRANVADILADAPVPMTHEQHAIPGPDGGTILLSIFAPAEPSAVPRPCIYSIHGGGLMFGNRFVGVHSALAWAASPGAVVASVEYRLVPEHPHPAPVEDCYSGLAWLAEHATELNIDPRRIMVAGSSGGGLLAAGVALLARDRNGPALCAQLLSCPMLDDRLETVSSQQYVEGDLWNRKSGLLAWKLLLCGREADIYAAPGRAKDMSRLPPTFIDVGSADTLRDEGVAYASRLWEHGVQTELHVWPGGFHGFDVIAPSARLSVQAVAAHCAWVKSVLAEI